MGYSIIHSSLSSYISKNKLFRIKKLDRKLFQYSNKISLDRFVILNSLAEWYVDDFVVFDSDHNITLIFHNSIDSSSTKAACQDTVVSGRATTTLQVT